LFYLFIYSGSGASNQWTLLFDGDVNLSAVMSFVSTASSFIMMPLYFYTFGRYYMDELSIRVPFLGLVRSLALVVIPYSVGIGISYCSPRIRAFVENLVKPMMLFLLIFFLIFGTIVNWYLIKTIDLYTALTAPLLPYLGFLIGALFAWICRLDWCHIKTVGIEAGIQNVGIAFMIILYSFPQPYATKALVVPLVVGFLTTKPFWLVYVIRSRIKKYQKKKELEKNKTKLTTVNNDGKLILTNEKLPSNNDDENNKKEDVVEMMQNL
jgi:predicted Na+-dependent transporter